MQLIQTVAPTAYPVGLAEAKDHLRVDHTEQDTLITGLIAAATEAVEVFTGRQLVAATWQMRLDAFWPGYLWLPHPPLLSISSIQYVDENGDTQTLSSSTYDVNVNGLIGQLYLAYGQSWPTTLGHPNSVIVTYMAGHGAPFTANASTDKLTLAGRVPADGDCVQLQNVGGEDGALPAGLSALTNYYMIESSGQTCELSTSSGGSKVDITDTGTGTHFLGVIPEECRAAIKLLLADLYEHPEAQAEGSLRENATIQRLLWNKRVEINF